MKAQFHLALPCLSISRTKTFYTESLGATIGRSAQNWIDINLFENQITFTKSGPFHFDYKSYSFNGDILPSFHFGVILNNDQWTQVLQTLKSKHIKSLTEVQFLQDKTGAHASFFVKDPNDYTVEFKCFNNNQDVFKY
ncbi:VOC family protein [Corallibacter vietnamensis]|uniref:VOC family protein n=1 Tax=Corallibacter vietnamensis TaxID=904130 RepID=A0ABP7GRC4_9FLAO